MPSPNQFDLLKQRRFAPFFWTQFLGAGNDNVFKNAFVVFVAFEAATMTSIDAGMVVNLIGAVFILPFMLFSATAGQLADKYEKSRLIRLIKLFEIAIMGVGFAGFALSNLTLLFVALALLGVHSTLFGPVKYAILPQALKNEELVGGNGMVEMGTFVAILLGTIAGGLVVAVRPGGPELAGGLAIAIAIAGWLVSRAIPVTPAVAPDLQINWNPFTETWKNIRFAQGEIVVWRSMLGISWFWFYGAIYLAQLPVFTRSVLGGDEHVFTFLLATVLGRHRCRVAPVREDVRPQGRARPRAVRLHRPHAVRARPLAGDARDERDHTGRARRVPRESARIGASPSTSCSSACSAASTSCRCTR